jgi:hypothetical protein
MAVPVSYRGMLIHVTHIDPAWLPNKDREGPFDLAVALDLLPIMASQGMNTLIVDIEDGVEYTSHPEMKRSYSVPIEQMRILADGARGLGMDVIPKLNFSKSGRNLHDMWMKPHWDHVSWLKDMDQYYAVAKDVIAELTEVMEPARFFHIGMDEDHYRSVEQYVDTIETLRSMVAGLGLRTVVWNDSCHYMKTKIAQVHADKCRTAEEHISKDIVHILWDYGRAHPEIVKRVSGRGFEVWAAPGQTPEMVAQWRQALEEGGGSGLIMTHWVKCDAAHKDILVNLLNTAGPGYGK